MDDKKLSPRLDSEEIDIDLAVSDAIGENRELRLANELRWLRLELERYREREPLVQDLLTAAANLITIEGCALPNEPQVRDLDEARMALELFKLSASAAAEGDESA